MRLFTHAFSLLALISIMAVSVSAQEPVKEPPPAGSEPTEPKAEPTPEKTQENGYVCRADIFYEWEARFPHEGKSRNEPAPRTYETYFSRAEESGDKKDEVVAAITSRKGMYESQALEHCRDERQTQTNCVAHKLRDIEQSYARADYASRTALLQSIVSDCKSTQGVCTKARLGEVVCAPRPAAPQAAPPAGTQSPTGAHAGKK